MADSSDEEVEFLGTNKSTKQESLPDVNSMKIKDIKRELESTHRISTALMIERNELVIALVNARSNGHNISTANGVADYRAAAHIKYQQQQMLSNNNSTQPANNNGSTSHQNKKESIRKLDTVKKLNTKQTQAYDLAIKEGKSIFITGPAGTGKSVLLKHIMATLEKQKGTGGRWAATSSTGTTAVALGGETLHHFAGCGVPTLVADFGRVFGIKRALFNWQYAETLIVDEVSMLAGEFLDNLSDIVKRIRHDNRPFGGIQLILCGDFLQLPPIQRNKNDVVEMMNHGKDLHEIHCNKGFAFQSKVWEEANMTTVILDEVFRQSNNKFIEVLHEIRKGNVSSESEKFLRKCERPLPPTPSGIIPTKLYSKNKNVADENNAQLNKLPGDPTHYTSIDYVVEEPFGSRKPVMKGEVSRDPLSSKESILCKNDFWDQCQGQSHIDLKPGAQVMLIQNFTVGHGDRSLANGSRGKVIEITYNPPKDIAVMEIHDGHPEGKPINMPYTIVEFINGERVAIGLCTFECMLSGVGVCVRLAIPLKLAWAISIHKSQGMTLDYVKVDLKGVFSEAQVYVALSRASNEDGLELVNFNPRLVRCDWRALKFYTDPTYKPRLWNEKPLASVNGREEAPPSANPGSLHGLSIVFTGELGSFDREKAELLVKGCGGVVRGSVSGKTNLLVVGTTLEDGREVESTIKYKKAKEIIDSDNNKSNLRIIDKGELFAIIKGTKTLTDVGDLKQLAKSQNVTSNGNKCDTSKEGGKGDVVDMYSSDEDQKPKAKAEGNKKSSHGLGGNVKFYQFEEGTMKSLGENDTKQTKPSSEMIGLDGPVTRVNNKQDISADGNTEKIQGRSKKEQRKEVTAAAKKRGRFDDSSSCSDSDGEEMKRLFREKQKKR